MKKLLLKSTLLFTLLFSFSLLTVSCSSDDNDGTPAPEVPGGGGGTTTESYWVINGHKYSSNMEAAVSNQDGETNTIITVLAASNDGQNGELCGINYVNYANGSGDYTIVLDDSELIEKKGQNVIRFHITLYTADGKSAMYMGETGVAKITVNSEGNYHVTVPKTTMTKELSIGAEAFPETIEFELVNGYAK